MEEVDESEITGFYAEFGESVHLSCVENLQIRPPFDVSGFADVEQVEKSIHVSGISIFHLNCQQIIAPGPGHDIEGDPPSACRHDNCSSSV